MGLGSEVWQICDLGLNIGAPQHEGRRPFRALELVLWGSMELQAWPHVLPSLSVETSPFKPASTACEGHRQTSIQTVGGIRGERKFHRLAALGMFAWQLWACQGTFPKRAPA